MPRPILATIDLAALRHNINRLRQAAPEAKLWAVAKANAYGHGLERVYPALRRADGIALLDLQEAERIRALGWLGPILLLEGVFEPRDLDVCSRLSLTHVVHTIEQARMLAQHKTRQPHNIYLKLNTGMNRLGLSPAIYRAVWTHLNVIPQVNDITLMTHFGLADDVRGVHEQMKYFASVTKGLPGMRSLANSAATLRFPMTQQMEAQLSHALVSSDWVRPGIALYGSSPDYPKNTAKDWGIKLVMSLRAKIISVQHLTEGDSMGYGAQFKAVSVMRVGIIACGYADGIMRSCTDKTPVLVGSVRSRVLGRVSMDMLVVDITQIPDANIGTEVTLWGASPCGKTILSIDEHAYYSRTLGYELMTGLATRIPVAVVDSESLDNSSEVRVAPC